MRTTYKKYVLLTNLQINNIAYYIIFVIHFISVTNQVRPLHKAQREQGGR